MTINWQALVETAIAAGFGAAAGGLIAGWVSTRLADRLAREAEAERRKLEREHHDRRGHIEVALAKLLGGLAMQGTGEANAISEGKRWVSAALSNLEELGVIAAEELEWKR